MSKLGLDFYTRKDVVEISRDLLGKVLVTEFEGQRTSGRITETEAYRAPDDRACHAFGNRRTKRTAVMFQEGGRAYIYLCYGIHQLFNVVTGPEGAAHAVLIRAIEPLVGIDVMQERRKLLYKGPSRKADKRGLMQSLTIGPGLVSKALGLHVGFTGESLISQDSSIWIEDEGAAILDHDIAAGKRIGVDYAGECAEWPWRFWLRDSKWHK